MERLLSFARARVRGATPAHVSVLLVVALLGTVLAVDRLPDGPETPGPSVEELVDGRGRIADVTVASAPDGPEGDASGALLPIPGSPTPEPTPTAEPTPTPSGTPAPSESPQDPPSPDTGTLETSEYTRVRLLVESTSDWTSAEILGARILEYRVDDTSDGADLERGGRGFVLRGVGTTRAEITTILHVPASSEPVLRLRKGYIGSVEASLVRTNTTPEPVVRLVNDEKLGDFTTRADVDRALLVGGGLDIPLRDDRRLALAFYYPWFHSRSFESRVFPDQPSGPYDTTDPEAVRAMVDEAAGAGVDGFVVSWDGEHTGGFEHVRTAAADRGGFHVSALLELKEITQNDRVDLDVAEDWVRDILSRASAPTYLHVGDRPVIFLFGTWSLSRAEWASFVDRFSDPAPFFVGDTLDPDFGLDGGYLYNPNREPPNELQTYYRSLSEAFRLPARLDPSRPQPLWAATVSPGQNDAFFRPWNPTFTARNEGRRYDRVWAAALGSSPEWVMITSWNEWYEQTHIQPGRNTGRRALNQTAAWEERFRYATG